MAVVLHQFPYSHFNEKARWALACKQVDYKRKSYLPGPHMSAIKKLSGQRSTPVLDWHGDIVPGSAAIINRLENEVPTPALYPADETLRAEALKVQADFDEVVGPATRTVLFAAMIDEGAYLTRMFSTGKSLPVRLFYRATFPMARGLIAKGNGVNPENIGRCKSVVDRTLDEVAEKVSKTGYMVGSEFSVADLTAAALIAPLANPRHPDMARPEPIPASIEAVLAKYREHPTIAWVNTMFEKHRV